MRHKAGYAEYLDGSDSDFYDEEELQNLLDDDEISDREQGYMSGYLAEELETLSTEARIRRSMQRRD